MTTSHHIFAIKATSMPGVINLEDMGERFTSKEEAKEYLSKALPKGSYVILEVFTVED